MVAAKNIKAKFSAGELSVQRLSYIWRGTVS